MLARSATRAGIAGARPAGRCVALPSLPPDAGGRHNLQLNKPVGRHLIALMRADPPLSPAQHGLLAACVSGRNACSDCHGVHADTVPVEERTKPLLRYARKLTQQPARMTQADADAVFAAGWSERARCTTAG